MSSSVRILKSLFLSFDMLSDVGKRFDLSGIVIAVMIDENIDRDHAAVCVYLVEGTSNNKAPIMMFQRFELF